MFKLYLYKKRSSEKKTVHTHVALLSESFGSAATVVQGGGRVYHLLKWI